MRLVLLLGLIGLSCTKKTVNNFYDGTSGDAGVVKDASFGGGSGGKAGDDASSGGLAGASGQAGAGGGSAGSSSGGAAGAGGSAGGTGSSTGGTTGGGGSGGTGGVDAGKACSSSSQCSILEQCLNNKCQQVITYACGSACPSGFGFKVATIGDIYECDSVNDCGGLSTPGVVCAINSSIVLAQGPPSCTTGQKLSVSVRDCAKGGDVGFCIAN